MLKLVFVEYRQKYETSKFYYTLYVSLPGNGYIWCIQSISSKVIEKFAFFKSKLMKHFKGSNQFKKLFKEALHLAWLFLACEEILHLIPKCRVQKLSSFRGYYTFTKSPPCKLENAKHSQLYNIVKLYLLFLWAWSP